MNKWLASAVVAMFAGLQGGCAQTGAPTTSSAAAPQPVDEGTVIAASLGYHGPPAQRVVRPAD